MWLLFMAVVAQSQVSVDRWITDDDYPNVAVARQEQGDVDYRLSLDGRGRVVKCEITKSSGSAVLDTTTCAILARRAMFPPTSLSAPMIKLGSYSWRLPPRLMTADTIAKELERSADALEKRGD